MSAGTETECCSEGTLTVLTAVDVEALATDSGGIVAVRNGGGADEEATELTLVSSQAGTLGNRSSISSLTLQSSSADPEAPCTMASTVGGWGGGMTGCCWDSSKCGIVDIAADTGTAAGLICSAGGRCSPSCSILMSEFTRTSDASGEDVVGIAACLRTARALDPSVPQHHRPLPLLSPRRRRQRLHMSGTITSTSRAMSKALSHSEQSPIIPQSNKHQERRRIRRRVGRRRSERLLCCAGSVSNRRAARED